MPRSIQVHNKQFIPFISTVDIAARVSELGEEISRDYAGKCPLLLSVLNGSFIFAADLFRAISVEAEIAFVRLSSYKGTSSTGTVLNTLELDTQVEGRHVIVVEDIVDTGRTLSTFLPDLHALKPASVCVASFLSKPEAMTHAVDIHYVGFMIPTKFVVGYGLDYDGLGRNISSLYQLAE
jgi:hypoxanthine phosphoribosyltransferase